jgi:2-polyprenyl-3-methyl-5-hydroxy-6-metoxy-1,4-benzoquinol methylase
VSDPPTLPLSEFFPEVEYGGFSNIDGTILFYQRVNALLKPESVVLDVGCGRGVYGTDPVSYRRNLRILQGKCQRVIGLDVNANAQTNPYIDEFRLIEAQQWPIAESSIDLCLADNVLEHVADPKVFLAECQRCVKPGGVLCIRTPNAWSYFGVFSRLVPNQRHAAVLLQLKPNLASEDIFPTWYRCNTVPALRRSLKRYGFAAVVYGYDAEPVYLMKARWLFYLGMLHRHLAPSWLKVGLHAFGRRVSSGLS